MRSRAAPAPGAAGEESTIPQRHGTANSRYVGMTGEVECAAGPPEADICANVAQRVKAEGKPFPASGKPYVAAGWFSAGRRAAVPVGTE